MCVCVCVCVYLVYFNIQVGDSNPSPLSQYQLYENPIAVEKTGTRIMAVARHGALTSSEITISDPYIVMAVKPTIKIPSGVSVGKALVEISTITPGATIYWTTDSSDPTIMSQKYDPAKGLVITQTRTVVKAISAASGVTTSEKAT